MSTNLPPQPNAMPILSVRNLVTEVATPDGRRTVVDDLSFDLATGETLCIAGEHDATTSPAIMQTTADLIAGARLEVVKDAGHIPCVERPKEVTGLIVGFLEEAGLC